MRQCNNMPMGKGESIKVLVNRNINLIIQFAEGKCHIRKNNSLFVGYN